jgi:virginiamycin B lyase
MRPQYVSPSTQGMTVLLSGPTSISTTIGLKPSSPGCSQTTSGTTCTVSFALVPCPSAAKCYTGSIATYDAVQCRGSTCVIPPGANALSANENVALSVELGKSNSIGLTLDGIPVSAILVPAASSSLTQNPQGGFFLPKCTIEPQKVSVVGVDAGGNNIVGPGAPVPALSSNDTTHLAVATPPPASSTFHLVPPSSLRSATIPNAGAVVQLTATVTPRSESGASVAQTAHVNVTFDKTVCGVITEYSIPTGNGFPFGIAAGSDGAMWFTEVGGNKIGRITTAGAITEASVPTPYAGALEIAAGPDGALWFTEEDVGQIGRITTGGTITETPLPSSTSGPGAITAGPDGALWFTEIFANRIGRLTTGGTITETLVPTPDSVPAAIGAGPDGALWFTENSSGRVGRITTDAIPTITDTATPTAGSFPLGIVTGPDGALWFTECGVSKIGRITTGGSITEMALTSGTKPTGIAVGPDGALWFTEYCGNEIGRITTGGSIMEFSVPTGASFPRGIALGPNGELWFTESSANQVARLQ